MIFPRALQERDFRSVWLAGLLSDTGDWMLLIALPIVVYGLTGSALGTSVAFLVELAPGIILAPFAGRLADRADRRRVMLVVCILQALSLLPLLFVGGHTGLAIVYAVIVVQASLATLFDPSKNALLPTLLRPETLVSGNSLIALNQGVGRLIGGPLGGILLAAGHLRVIVIADAASFLAAAALIAALPATATRDAADAPLAAHRKPRLAFIATLRSQAIRGGLLVTFVAQIAQGIFVVLFILFVARELHGGSSEIGLLRGVQAVGAIGAGLVLGFIRTPSRPARLIAIGALAFGIVDLTIWNASQLTTDVGLYALLFALAGAPGVLLETGLISYFQLAAADDERGRAFGAYGLVSNAGQGVGMVAAGLLTAPLGLMALLNAQGCLYLLGGALAAVVLTRTRPDRTPRTTAVSARSAGRA
jgi:MFS family permease